MDGKITYAEFCHAVTPSSKEYSQIITGRPEFFSRKNIPPTEYFNVDTRNEIRTMFKVMFHTERASECLRARIAKRPQFSLDQAFSYMDRNRDGLVTPDEIRDMLAEHGFFATEKELQFIMLKFDKDRD
jgi:hypothetical protein